MKKFFAFSILSLGIFFAAISLIKAKSEGVAAYHPESVPPVKAELVTG